MNALHRYLLARDVGIAGAFLLGFIERRDSSGITWDGDPGSPRSCAYDQGRSLLGGIGRET